MTVMMNVQGEPKRGCRFRWASPGGARCIYSSFLCTDRNPLVVTIVIGVLTILGLVIVTVALLYVFWKHGDTYVVNQGSTWLPLTSKQPDQALGEEPS